MSSALSGRSPSSDDCPDGLGPPQPKIPTTSPKCNKKILVIEIGFIEPTYALFLHLKGENLDYDPLADIKTVAAAVAARNKVSGMEIKNMLGIPESRINRAVAYLENQRMIRVVRESGTSRFTFLAALSTSKTHRFVEENCK